MATRDIAPAGAPCWTDLWTSDVAGSRAFYSELFGWVAEEPSPEFGGYFMFTRNGVPVAGAMGAMGDQQADDTWKVYLQTDDMAGAIARAEANGGNVPMPAMPVADLGIQSVFVDPTGATIGAWQPGTFQGFTVLNEHGAPSWFELFTFEFATAIAFYETVFGWETDVVSDTDEFRYSTVRGPAGAGELAGIGDGSTFLPERVPAHWSVYWEVDDVDATIELAQSLGGAVLAGAQDSPYGRMASLADPAGAQFKLRTGP